MLRRIFREEGKRPAEESIDLQHFADVIIKNVDSFSKELNELVGTIESIGKDRNDIAHPGSSDWDEGRVRSWLEDMYGVLKHVDEEAAEEFEAVPNPGRSRSRISSFGDRGENAAADGTLSRRAKKGPPKIKPIGCFGELSLKSSLTTTPLDELLNRPDVSQPGISVTQTNLTPQINVQLRNSGSSAQAESVADPVIEPPVAQLPDTPAPLPIEPPVREPAAMLLLNPYGAFAGRLRQLLELLR